MSDTQHTDYTPGPWTVNEHEHAITPYITIKKGSWDIAHNRHSAVAWEVERANARLIAAAPDLLEACRDALEVLGQSYVHPKWQDMEKPTLDMLEAAIAKATSPERRG